VALTSRRGARYGHWPFRCRQGDGRNAAERGRGVDRSFVNCATLMTAKTSGRAWRWLGCWSVAWWQWLIDGGDAGGVHPVRLADGRSGGVVGQGGALLRCGVVQRERGSEADWLWPRADGLAGVDGLACGYTTGEVALTPRAVRRPPPLVRIFAIDLVQELVRAGRAQGSGAPSPRSRRAVGSLTTGVPESSSKKSGRRCRIGAVVFVAGVRPPARGGTKVKEPRS
jgi:hypothetical protein